MRPKNQKKASSASFLAEEAKGAPPVPSQAKTRERVALAIRKAKVVSNQRTLDLGTLNVPSAADFTLGNAEQAPRSAISVDAMGTWPEIASQSKSSPVNLELSFIVCNSPSLMGHSFNRGD